MRAPVRIKSLIASSSSETSASRSSSQRGQPSRSAASPPRCRRSPADGRSGDRMANPRRRTPFLLTSSAGSVMCASVLTSETHAVLRRRITRDRYDKITTTGLLICDLGVGAASRRASVRSRSHLGVTCGATHWTHADSLGDPRRAEVTVCHRTPRAHDLGFPSAAAITTSATSGSHDGRRARR